MRAPAHGIKLALIRIAFGTSLAGGLSDARAVEWSGSGFLTLAAGRVLSGSLQGVNPTGYRCPCFISDYAQGGVYEDGGVRFGPDSRLGLQGRAGLGERLGLTGQLVARGADAGSVALEWAYADYRLDEASTLQVGRKRLPLFYYSESQDVGFSYPWVHLPPQAYGWEIVNYNGINLAHQGRLGDWSTHLNLFAGSESKKDAGFWKLYDGKDTRTDVRWSGIVGAELFLQRDWFEGRLVHIESDTRQKDVTGGLDWSPKAHQRISGLSLALDPGRWVIRAEWLHIDRKQDYGGDAAGLLGIGYRIGEFLPMITRASYRQRQLADAPNGLPGNEERHDVTSLTLRWDLTATSAIKAQYDVWQDRSGALYNDPVGGTPFGSSRLLSLSYDRVF